MAGQKFAETTLTLKIIFDDEIVMETLHETNIAYFSSRSFINYNVSSSHRLHTTWFVDNPLLTVRLHCKLKRVTVTVMHGQTHDILSYTHNIDA